MKNVLNMALLTALLSTSAAYAAYEAPIAFENKSDYDLQITAVEQRIDSMEYVELKPFVLEKQASTTQHVEIAFKDSFISVKKVDVIHNNNIIETITFTDKNDETANYCNLYDSGTVAVKQQEKALELIKVDFHYPDREGTPYTSFSCKRSDTFVWSSNQS